MNVLAAAKQEVKDALTAKGVNVYVDTASRLQTNTVIIEPGQPYLEPSTEFGMTQIRLNLVVVGPALSNSNGFTEVESLLVKVLNTLDNWDIELVAQPGEMTWGTATYLSVALTVTANINLKEVI